MQQNAMTAKKRARTCSMVSRVNVVRESPTGLADSASQTPPAKLIKMGMATSSKLSATILLVAGFLFRAQHPCTLFQASVRCLLGVSVPLELCQASAGFL